MAQAITPEDTGVRLPDPAREAWLMRGVRFIDSSAALRADRDGRVIRPLTHVHAESVMADL